MIGAGLGPAGASESRFRALANKRAITVENNATLANGEKSTLAITVEAGKFLVIESFGAIFETNQNGQARLVVHGDEAYTGGVAPDFVKNRTIGEDLPEGFEALAEVELSGTKDTVGDVTFYGSITIDSGYAIYGPRSIVFEIENLDASSGSLELSFVGAILNG